MKKHLVAGIIAHVDAGKTTLSEAMLYQAGALRKLGRVDKGDAFLDPDQLEKQRGITIFSHEATLTYQNLDLTLLDTPGHADFASQTEQVLSVLDVAILVISATDGIQGYTRTLWRLLDRYGIPTFIFVNKMDAPDLSQGELLDQLQQGLSQGCVAFEPELSEAAQETIALQDEAVLDQFLATGELAGSTVQQMIKHRQIFPCYFGSALKLTGVDSMMTGLERWATPMQPEPEFGARVFKITHDEKGERLTWLRVTGGTLRTKDQLIGDQKANQIRLYNGERYQVVSEVEAGTVCAVTGLADTQAGMGLGSEPAAGTPVLQPVLTYALDPLDHDLHVCLAALRQLEDEDPLLHVSWSEQLQEIRVQIMGEIQLEVLQQLLLDRFGLTVAFDEGGILYRETITAPVEGVGHFEPLRHYAEVHLLLEPAPRGSGLTFTTDCSLEVLDKNWQHQVSANLSAKEHRGVLIGVPLTDVKITLIGGRGSLVHTVGGDFREATWRAMRQGLMVLRQQGYCQLLEPWYQFRLEIGLDQVGRAMTDVQRMHGTLDPAGAGEGAVDGLVTLTGSAPVSEMRTYAQEVHAYTHGQGQLECFFLGYLPCHDEAEVVETQQYDPITDYDNQTGSVFCAHGAGYPVPWNEVPEAAHYPYQYPVKFK
ncbi:elongation factor G [Levilactobacillus bambusae]|uniref:Elongation factor G n=1 Tax=Levilactobacillus bambusae TaxID=2024736 RepID=A0A2V1N037_9LACO|nr:TetM/TetW/TetO/TetS family tetracycline resistance ribosomal protection protein [Levilactobacillus bambusae]PWG00432.1 elongation factor G [Levilactobacillus bambusae]